MSRSSQSIESRHVQGELAGRTSFITGAARGVGREIAVRFAAEGSTVFVADIDEAGCLATAKAIEERGGRAVAVYLDVADALAVEKATKDAMTRVAAVDVLVNVAGIGAAGSITEISIEDWDRTMAVNARGAFLCSRAFLPGMVAQKRGVILNISSTAAFKATWRAGAYNASNAAVVGITRNIALDYAASGIRAIAICPGPVETDMDAQVHRFCDEREEYRKLAVKAHPVGRLGKPSDIADAALFLASDRASWMTGSPVIVDGGTLV